MQLCRKYHLKGRDSAERTFLLLSQIALLLLRVLRHCVVGASTTSSALFNLCSQLCSFIVKIFETLRRVGQHHELSAGLVIGGKDLKFEWKRVHSCNILVCTPGRYRRPYEPKHILQYRYNKYAVPVLVRCTWVLLLYSTISSLS